MRIHTLLFISFGLLSGPVSGQAQTDNQSFEINKAFVGAKATHKKYRAIYQLDNNDPKVIEKAIRNMNNALNDPRLTGKLQLELIVFGAGTEANLKGGKYEAELGSLVQKGVILAQCNNTLREKKIPRDQLYDFVAVVPSGNGELIIRAGEGWTIIKP